MRAFPAGLALIGATLLAACVAASPAQGPSVTPEPGSPSTLKVEEIASGLQHGWDIGFLPDGKVLVTQRPGRIAMLSGSEPGAEVIELAADLSDVYARGEGGLMGLAVLPEFAQTRRFVTCQTHQENGRPVDVRLVTWELDPAGRAARRIGELLTGLPINQSGRHSGCRPTIAPDGALLVGTGDTASNPAIPQDRTSLGGKLLRIDRNTGNPLSDNPFAASPNPNEQRLFSYGHRNVQGVAVRPSDGSVFTLEHGPTGFDELNVSRAGGNYGWDPSRGETTDEYDEDVPMTDLQRFPDAVKELWTSGTTTEAPSGAAFLSGSRWGALDGSLAVVALRGQKLLLFALDPNGAVTKVTLPPELNDTFGRLRAARTGPGGALFVTTSNGQNDKLIRVTPG